MRLNCPPDADGDLGLATSAPHVWTPEKGLPAPIPRNSPSLTQLMMGTTLPRGRDALDQSSEPVREWIRVFRYCLRY